jgi:hypothetical protein
METLKVNRFEDLLVNDTFVWNYGDARYGTMRVLKVHTDRVFAMDNWEGHSIWGKPMAREVYDINRIGLVYRDTGWDT